MQSSVNTSLLNACTIGDYNEVRLCLEHGADPNQTDVKGRTPLHLAAARGHTDIMTALLQADAQVNLLDSHGNTPLHFSGHVEVVIILLKCGIDPSIRNQHGDTAMDIMERKGINRLCLDLLETWVGQSTTHSVSSRKANRNWVVNIWYNFYMDIGAEKLVLIIFIITLLSLFIAYNVAEYSRSINMRHPVDGTSHKVEL